MMRYSILLVVFVAGASGTLSPERPRAQASRRMSFHNRLLLNRAVVSGLGSIEVLVLAAKGEAAGFQASVEEVARLVGGLGGRIGRVEADIGYLRLEVPTDRVLDLVASSAIDAYQIASRSKGAWYRDGPPLSNAEMFRGFEVTPVAAGEPSGRYADLPPLSVPDSRDPGYTAEDDVGLRAWMADHPTFDGRGVTIALVENGIPAFDSPILRPAKTLDGRDVPKIAGILNAIDASRRDDTRVTLATHVRAETGWARIGSRTYIVPRPGSYRFGVFSLPAGANLAHQFGVLEHADTREVWLDTNGDASFQDESPLVDVNETFEPRRLTLRHPRQTEVSFVMGLGRAPHTVHIYVGKGSHQTMTLSVAAGSRTDDSLAYGVAPNARVLLVRVHGSDYELDTGLEGFIEAAQRSDVDVICSSVGLTMVPDTASEFAGLLFQRLIDIYRKPIINGANNRQLQLNSSLALAGTLSVSGVLGPQTWAALYGGRPLEQLIVHPLGAAGPSLDGAIKPDFLAPMERLAADVPWNRSLEAVPRQAPRHALPPGYQTSCCTSASGPYAAGVAALLISAARQTNVRYSLESLTRAMKSSARFLPAFASHEQGNGVLDINAAWRELTRSVSVPRIVASARIVHPLAQYAARGPNGVGILEFEGWTVGTAGTRAVQLRRESGSESAVTYRLMWTGNDGTYKAQPTVTLPLGRTVIVPITIAPRTSGAHSALLDLHDITSNTIVFRTQATIVAAERVDPSTDSARIAGRVGLMRTNQHYFHVPACTEAIHLELDVLRGVVTRAVLPAHGLFPNYYFHLYPGNSRAAAQGRHALVLPNPEPGTWTIQVSNTSTWLRAPGDPTPPDDRDAEYALTVRIHRTSLRAAASRPPAISACPGLVVR